MTAHSTEADDILEYASSLFDTAGVSELGGERLLILSLESTPERDLGSCTWVRSCSSSSVFSHADCLSCQRLPV